MMPYQDERRTRNNPGPSQQGRFTQVRNGGYPVDPVATRNQMLERQAYMAQQPPPSLRSSSVSVTASRHAQNRRPPATGNDVMMEMDRMKRTIMGLQEQLALADDTISVMKKKEKEMNDKKAQDLQNTVEMSGKFENLSQGVTRPTQIVEKYGNLYTQGRIDAMDDLDQVAGLSKYGKQQEMKQKVLYGIMVASYKVSYDYLHQLKLNLRRLMGIPEKHSAKEKDAHGEAVAFLTTYFQSTTQTFNVGPIVDDVQEQLAQLLPEFPSLSKLPGIASYSAECCRISWSMVNQIPPMELEHSQEKFQPNMHTRFHSSSDKNSKIKMYVWPALVDASDKSMLYKGVVWT